VLALEILEVGGRGNSVAHTNLEDRVRKLPAGCREAHEVVKHALALNDPVLEVERHEITNLEHDAPVMDMLRRGHRLVHRDGTVQVPWREPLLRRT
jgi:hypothetical protein